MIKLLTTLTAAALAAMALALGAGAQAAGAQATTAASTPAECSVGQLSAALTPGSPGAGQRYATLTLTNRSKTTCRTGGYVGLGLQSSGGRPVATNAVRIDEADVRTIVVKPGGHTRSLLHWAVVEGTGDKPGGPCFVAPHAILVTPPNAYRSLTLPWNQGTVCEAGTIDITPLGTV